MEFPLNDLLNRDKCRQWILEHFHPDGLSCPNCKAGVEQARRFRTTHRSQLRVYRCRVCDHTYNLYSGTLLAQHHLRPERVVLLLRGILKGESTKSLAGELQLNYKTVLTLPHQLQDRAETHPRANLDTFFQPSVNLTSSTARSCRAVTIAG
ncbi:MAG: hypothetical protein IGR93_19895, partial [Hydrococcus sp. C42_A2020_068]|nr:hypothetical protein [Hydrococcus sp. C42_A2020_068]